MSAMREDGTLTGSPLSSFIRANNVECWTMTAVLEAYGFTRFAGLRADGDQFLIDVEDHDLARLPMCLYAFVVGNEIVRIGSSKAPLGSRMGSWRRDVSGALAGKRTSTPSGEAEGWRRLLSDQVGAIYARQGTEVTTQIGTFNAYMAEESYLIGLHRPPLNRSMHR